MSGNPFQPLAAHLQTPTTPRRQSNAPGSSSTAAPPPVTPSGNVNGNDQNGQHSQPRRRKNHRGGAKKKRNRRKSFAVLPEESHDEAPEATPERQEFYLHRSNLSNTSIESEALLDHRDQQSLRTRRPSIMTPSGPFPTTTPQTSSRLRNAYVNDSGEDGEQSWDEGAPLLSRSIQRTATAPVFPGYGSGDPRQRVSRRGSSRSSRTKLAPSFPGESYNVNYPPSMPGSPQFRPSDPLNLSFGDVMIHDDEIDIRASPRGSRNDSVGSLSDREGRNESSPDLARRNTIALTAQEDVCFPSGISEIGEEELHSQDPTVKPRPRRRRRRWPDLSILEEWSRFEKEGRSEERRVKRITEPQLINGRLRPVTREWYRAEEESPYRFTYFNEEFQSTIHSQTISELVQPGGNFQELFIPEPRILSDDESEDSDEDGDPIPLSQVNTQHSHGGQNGESRAPTRQPSLANTQPRDGVASPEKNSGGSSRAGSVHRTPTGVRSPVVGNQTTQTPELLVKAPRYGERPVWWLDVLSPTEAEMKVLSKAFGIHPLTAEDIMVQEAREKVELFRHYYFVNYRSFDQDQNSEDYLEPVNMYVVVFREGVISFHFSMTPHPANVRRRIRQLKDYLIVNSDWISYAIIDDITDVFVPLIQNIEDEVDDIDDAILRLHSHSEDSKNDMFDEKASNTGTTVGSEGDMLRRVGDCRKRVMSLYRLLGNKADVIKGFAKRCNERWEVAPRSDIGLYLGDIQDHIVTMTSNLSHYEKILARSHANYLAQINIRMNERQEQTADVLGKLTVLGTIVLPMNIITGLWGMNVWVPGQEYEGDLKWFWAITAGLLAFGLACYMIAKRVYNIV
ncbi:manganese resistance protein mnr2 [Colletotrichum truncatum]|uniref:Manganese resistance protein mnr2 n=1 Tax=Colletotrichum truncatum TaxID=5467 RepID=A0ACC3Z3R2_COLTU|nr:manganese resistance protein mnr2 [Colletotrichum truncatum]KAF6795571.1 manganese resistance protein mnr2 [Colletotrichum truncatum]